MPTIKIENFKGIIPAIHPSLLPAGCAIVAHNCRIKTGKLIPIRQPVKISGNTIWLENGLGKIADAKSLYAWRRTVTNGTAKSKRLDFLAWPGNVSVAKGNLADDDYERLFVSGETGVGTKGTDPCVYLSGSGGNSIIRRSLVKGLLPVPVATNGTHAGDVHLSDNNLRYTFFFQTWVDSYGYESGISEQSFNKYKNASSDSSYDSSCDGTFEYLDGDRVIFAAIDAKDVPDGAESATRRFYKVVTGTTTDSIQYIGEGKVGDKVTITLKDEDAGEVMQEIVSPPNDLKYITAMTGIGDFYCGFSASTPRTVMFSDIELPMSWPIAYRYDVKDDIVGLAVTSNSVFVLTNGYPWVITGTAPESMTAAMLAGPAACVSQRSICVYKNSVFYASHAGICTIYNDAVAGTIVQNITDKFFTYEQWQKLNPSTCLMAQYRGALHCFFPDSTTGYKGYVIDVAESERAITTHDEEASCLCVDGQDDALYYVRED